jgi:hypothetical protein
MSENHANTINELRGELFATIRAIRDPTNPMDINRAKAVADVAGRIIDSAKAETDYVRAFGGRGVVPASGFIGQQRKPDTLEQQATVVDRGAGLPVAGGGLPPSGPRGTL